MRFQNKFELGVGIKNRKDKRLSSEGLDEKVELEEANSRRKKN